MKKLFVALMSITLTLGLFGCQADITEIDTGSDDPVVDEIDDNVTTTDDVEVELAQGVTDTTVLVGNSAATTGALAFVGVPFNQGIESYFAMVNEAGGVAGRTIEFINYDDEFNGATGLTYAEKLIEDDEIFAFVGHFGTPTVSATLDYLKEVGIPQVYYATGISALFNPHAFGNERSSFPVQPIYDAEGQVMVARAISDLSATTIGVIYTNDDAGNGIRNGILLQAGKAGIEIVQSQVASDSVDMSSAAATLINGGADVVLIAANQVPAEVAIKALDAAGNEAPVIVSYVNAAPSFIANIASVLSNFDVYTSAWINLFQADGNFTDAYVLFATEISKADPTLAANPYAIAGWVAASFFVEGLERVGDDPLTWANYIKAMEEAPVANPLGGTVDYANGSRVGTQSMSLLKATIIAGTDGAQDTYSFASFKPMETIESILNK